MVGIEGPGGAGRRQQKNVIYLRPMSDRATTVEFASEPLDRRDHFQVLKDLAPGARLIIDIGANIGLTVKAFRHRFPSATIHAFEPNAELNPDFAYQVGQDPNVRLLNVAVSDQSGTKALHVNWIRATSSLLPYKADGRRYRPKPDRLVRTEAVATVTLDDYARSNGIDAIDILKLDIQGAEASALRGAAGLLNRHQIGIVYTEVFFVHYYAGDVLFHELTAQMEGFGYTLYDLFLNRHGRNRQLLFGDAIFINRAVRSKIDGEAEEP